MPQDPVIYSSNLQSGLTLTDPTLTGAVKLQEGFVNITAATTLTAEDHAGRVMRFNVAAGVTVTLPAATGTGNRYRFIVNTTVTSAADIVAVVGNDGFFGMAYIVTDSDSVDLRVHGFKAAADSDQISMNGTTTGGIAGDWIEVIDMAADRWYARCFLAATGTEATPFLTGQVS